MLTMSETEIKRRRPIERVIWEFNGPAALAKLLGVHVSAVHQWKQNNRIPAKRQREILEQARELGITVRAEDLIG